ncbi:MAG: YihA family ribosome biogenesis GTP-binding protein [Hyphomonadaceae bacterium]|nr:YihA family ribosome biogenesis GTP-binding protein [Hyphomonadaceae bacterium]MBC6411767.1 YihA family ribosome biogenesis GTP-binding protein [Hyphomonadaceae bacterium]
MLFSAAFAAKARKRRTVSLNGIEDKTRFEAGRLLFARPVRFVRSVVSVDGLPVTDLPEICFAGRSNVGKSSLINALTGRKGLARASNTPGRTRALNFFIADDRIHLVDLPGYGYARASRVDIVRWTELTRAYLAGRAPLRRIFLLVDSRHGLKNPDHEIMTMLDAAAVTYQIVLTKIDKIKNAGLVEVTDRTQKHIAKRPAAFPHIIQTSSTKNAGLDVLKAGIATLALPDHLGNPL